MLTEQNSRSSELKTHRTPAALSPLMSRYLQAAYVRSKSPTDGEEISRKRHQRPLAADRNRGKWAITAGPSRSDRSARAAALPLNGGTSLIVVSLLSLGLWAVIWGAVASLASAVLG
jgi:hypothetical protein